MKSNIQERIKKLIDFMKQDLVEKDDAVKLALLSSVAGESIFFLGPPGTAKSMVSRKLSEIIKLNENKESEETKYFEYLMNQMSTPDEVFGPVKITELEHDNYERNTKGFLPSANVVFLDEIWKAGPVILNTLLTIINEKKFHNGKSVVKVPLKALISASNELPSDDKRGGGLEALWDRFLVRLIVNRISEDDDFLKMICKDEDGKSKIDENEIKELLLSTSELEEWQKDGGTIDKIEVPENVRQTILAIRKDWDSKGLDYYVSDRRWKKIVRLLKTSAFLNGRNEVDLMDCLLIKYCIWNKIDKSDKENEIDQTVEAKEIVEKCIQQNCGSIDAPIEEMKQKVEDFAQDVLETFKDSNGITNSLREKLVRIEDEKYENLKEILLSSIENLNDESKSKIQSIRNNLFGNKEFAALLEKTTSKTKLDLEAQLIELEKIRKSYVSGNLKEISVKSSSNVNVVSKIANQNDFVLLDKYQTPFYISKYQVTQELYEKVMGANPSNFKGKNLPVETVSWYDAIYFCNKLSVMDGFEPVYSVKKEIDEKKWNYSPHNGNSINGNITQNTNANGYRLPTEREWQYAAKGGESYRYSGSNNLNEVGWYIGNNGNQTHKVGQKKANRYGLYDMSGNVWEWCWDVDPDYSNYRYSRGGSYDYSDRYCEVDFRDSHNAYYRDNRFGFRIVRSS